MPIVYLRWQAPVRNRRGFYPGIFALVNGLSSEGRLTDEQEHFRTTTNAWYHANMPNPADADPALYDRTLNPGAAAWFKPTARACLAKIPGYLQILQVHDVACGLVRSSQPGKIIYADLFQIVTTPTHRPQRPPATD